MKSPLQLRHGRTMASCMLAEQPDDCSTCIEKSLTAPSRKQTASHLPSGLAARCSPLPGRQCVKVSWSLVPEWESSIMSCVHTALFLHHTLKTRYNLHGTSQPATSLTVHILERDAHAGDAGSATCRAW